MSNQKIQFKGNSELFGIWVPVYIGVTLAIPIFWGSGTFNPRGLFIYVYIVGVCVFQYILLTRFFFYQSCPDNIFIKYPLSFRQKSLKISIKEISSVSHDPKNHKPGMYSTKDYVEIKYGHKNSFLLPVNVSKYNKKISDLIELLQSNRRAA